MRSHFCQDLTSKLLKAVSSQVFATSLQMFSRFHCTVALGRCAWRTATTAGACAWC